MTYISLKLYVTGLGKVEIRACPFAMVIGQADAIGCAIIHIWITCFNRI